MYVDKKTCIFVWETSAQPGLFNAIGRTGELQMPKPLVRATDRPASDGRAAAQVSTPKPPVRCAICNNLRISALCVHMRAARGWHLAQEGLPHGPNDLRVCVTGNG